MEESRRTHEEREATLHEQVSATYTFFSFSLMAMSFVTGERWCLSAIVRLPFAGRLEGYTTLDQNKMTAVQVLDITQ